MSNCKAIPKEKILQHYQDKDAILAEMKWYVARYIYLNNRGVKWLRKMK